jgi:hypothetical protein
MKSDSGISSFKEGPKLFPPYSAEKIQSKTFGTTLIYNITPSKIMPRPILTDLLFNIFFIGFSI